MGGIIEMSKRSQKDIVLNHLRKYGSINSLEAIRRYGITRISAVIYKIRNSGIPITATPDIPTAPQFVTYRIDHEALRDSQYAELKNEVEVLGVASEGMTPHELAHELTELAIKVNRFANSTHE